jgi:response regulator NasT
MEVAAQPMRVLIADDNVIVRVDLRAILEEAGHEVCAETRDGLEAVDLARATLPDLAILDVRMPRLHGIEAARRILRERPIPIVILTGYTDYALTDLAAATGVSSSFLAKPFSDQDVGLALEEAVLQHAAATASREPAEPRSRLRALFTHGRRASA